MKLIVILKKISVRIGSQVVREQNSTGQEIVVRRNPMIQVHIMTIQQELIKDIISTLMHRHQLN